MKRHIPNIITVCRLILAPVLLAYVLTARLSPKTHLLVVLAVIILAVSDKLDGWLARRWKCTSKFGAKWDPLADKLTVLLFVPLIIMQMIHFVPVVIIFVRDLLSTGIRVALKKSVPARPSGQVKTAVNLVCMCVLFAAIPIKDGYIPLLHLLRDPLYWITGGLISLICIWSGWDYISALWLKQRE